MRLFEQEKFIFGQNWQEMVKKDPFPPPKCFCNGISLLLWLLNDSRSLQPPETGKHSGPHLLSMRSLRVMGVELMLLIVYNLQYGGARVPVCVEKSYKSRWEILGGKLFWHRVTVLPHWTKVPLQSVLPIVSGSFPAWWSSAVGRRPSIKIIFLFI